MSTKTKTYKFRTFQELLNRVPAGRICDCLSELALVLSTMKLTVEAAHSLQHPDEPLAEELPEGLLTLPDELEWKDDGKGELGVSLHDTEGKYHGDLDIADFLKKAVASGL